MCETHSGHNECYMNFLQTDDQIVCSSRCLSIILIVLSLQKLFITNIADGTHTLIKQYYALLSTYVQDSHQL